MINVYEALIQGVVAANLSGYKLECPNGSFDTPNNETWLRVNVLDMGDLPVTLGDGGYNEVSGVMQVDVFAPKLATEAYRPAIAAVQEIKDTLKTGAWLESNGQKVRINSAPCRPSTSEDTWYHWIITVNFTAYLIRG